MSSLLVNYLAFCTLIIFVIMSVLVFVSGFYILKYHCELDRLEHRTNFGMIGGNRKNSIGDYRDITQIIITS
ncbi:hypothetical protein CRE_09036 [Caenorhabditis remanei]|uniref:Uncharacterized protein n=1 Tax=Caenorhabditis remanei TaxID=31234 RepID=E3LIX4_CAERE|nr:hypothetical protein CRE_09036 [Caenorhabditis remanei]